MIASGGENIFSAEVESALALHPGIEQVAVSGVPDERWGERVHAVLSEDAVIEHGRERIAGHECPRSVEIRSVSLPLSLAGKILKTNLPAPNWLGRARNVA